MYLLYDLILLIIIIISTPYILYQVFRSENKKEWQERFGLLSADLVKSFEDKPTIWIHAASVGETIVGGQLTKKLKADYPDHQILFSTMTTTGQELARKSVEKIDGLIFLPLDFSWIIRRVVRQIKPELLIVIETELWPNLIREAHLAGVRIMVASGRISDASIKKYKYLGPLLKKMMTQVDVFSMQSERDVQRITSLGALPEKVYQNGNIKYDRDFQLKQDQSEQIYTEFKLDKSQPILVAGSTHDNEEEQLISLFQQLKSEFPDIVMLLAPRYIKRTEEIEQLFKKAGLKTVRRTKIEKRNPETDSIIIVDSIGELAGLYQIADLVFIGGSLIKRGGHNILEPAAYGKAPFFGPHMFNFKEDTKYLLTAGAGIQVSDNTELTKKMLFYLNHPAKLRKMGKKAKRLITENRGAIKRTLSLINNLIQRKPKILIVRLSAIGDVIHALPVARAVRESYPEAEISWLVEDKAKDMVTDHPELDQIIVMPRKTWKKVFKENKWQAVKAAMAFFKKLRSYNFDIVLDIHGIFKSALPAYLTKAPLRYGPADGREGSRLFYNRLLKPPAKKMHVIDRNLYLAQGIGAIGAKKNKDMVSFALASDQKAVARIDSLLAEIQASGVGQKKIVVINPYTTWETKNWLEERYALLADMIITQTDSIVIFTGGPAGRAGISKICRMMKNRAYNLAGETDLKELTELYRRVDLFIGGDTGPMHLAVAVGLKVIALMGPTNPVTHGPYGQEHMVIQSDLECKNCWQRKCPHAHECMQSIMVEDVFKAARKVLVEFRTDKER